MIRLELQEPLTIREETGGVTSVRAVMGVGATGATGPTGPAGVADDAGITAIDANPASALRVQQDLRHSATYAPLSAVNNQTGTTYTLALADSSKLVTLSNTAPIVCTLPQDSVAAIPVGSRIPLAQINTGQVVFAAGPGATVNATPGQVCATRYNTVTAIKRAANTWLLDGTLTNSLVTDTFDRADSTTSLGSATTGGHVWATVGGGAWGIATNKAYMATPTADAVATLDVGVSDCTISCDVLNVTDGDGIMFRSIGAAANDGFLVYLAVGEIMCLVPGFGAHLTGSPVAMTMPTGATYTIKVALLGSSIKVYIDDVLKIDTTSSTQQTATKIGLRNGGTLTTPRWDNLLVTL